MAAAGSSQKRQPPPPPVRRVAVCGGTHGNETTALELARHYARRPQELERPTLRGPGAVRVVVTNERAVAANTRYVCTDLNRCFLRRDLARGAGGFPSTDYERRRALELNAALGPKGAAAPAVDFLVDLHNTTSATTCLCLAPDDSLALHVAASVARRFPEQIRVVVWGANPDGDWGMLPTVARSGLTLEVGSTPWGCVVGERWAFTRRIVAAVMDCLEAHNRNRGNGVNNGCSDHSSKHKSGTCCRRGRCGRGDACGGRSKRCLAPQVRVPVYQRVGVVDFPRFRDGALAGAVHSSLQGRDFRALRDGDPIFSLFDGTDVLFDRREYPWLRAAVAFPIFVNEAAYYEKGIAFALCHRDDSHTVPGSLLPDDDAAAGGGGGGGGSVGSGCGADECGSSSTGGGRGSDGGGGRAGGGGGGTDRDAAGTQKHWALPRSKL